MMEETKVLEMKPTHPHKIDANKIKTLDDVILILGILGICVNDEGFKKVEHLIVKDDE